MSDQAKAKKKEAKAAVKVEKARAAAAEKRDAGTSSGVGVTVRRHEGSSELVVTGLSDRQLERVVPGITREVAIAVTAERSAFKAGLLRFVKEGLFQTIIKVVAGLVVGYLLIRYGPR
jgi:hypothetical protein